MIKQVRYYNGKSCIQEKRLASLTKQIHTIGCAANLWSKFSHRKKGDTLVLRIFVFSVNRRSATFSLEDIFLGKPRYVGNFKIMNCVGFAVSALFTDSNLI